MNMKMIQMGNIDDILSTPNPNIISVEKWKQQDSDILAHLINVQIQIQNSRWMKTDESVQWTIKNVSQCKMPEFEDFVFAAVYLRNLTSRKDCLLKKAVNVYCNHADSDIRKTWIQYELSQFEKQLKNNALMLQEEISVEKLFKVFLYGASLLHICTDVNDEERQLFLKLYDDTQHKHLLLLALHSSLKCLMGPVSNVAVLIHKDFGRWLNEHELPKPDIRWHDRLFYIEIDN